VLADQYGRVLDNGEVELVREGGSFLIRYHEHELPVSPRSIDGLVARAAERLAQAASPLADELASIANALGRLPHALVTDQSSVIERHRDKEVLRNRLASLCGDHVEIGLAVDEEVKFVNENIEELHELLERQNYRLAYWRTAGRELDYRRFFDITTLVALRAEDEAVFEHTHALVIELVKAGSVDGLRIDHVDGLRDPLGYLERLRGAIGPETYLVVEKILEGDEQLRSSWPVDGTSGYDFLSQVNALLHDPSREDALTGAYLRFGGDSTFAAMAHAAKHEIMRSVLATDIERLTEQFANVTEYHRRHRDYTRAELRDALREAIASFSVYRTYVRHGHRPEPDDVRYVNDAISRAASARPELDSELFRFLSEILLLDHDGRGENELAERFQQVSAPVMAKAVEDTAFYRYLRLVSLNEVGGDPAQFGIGVGEFHERMQLSSGRRSLLATSTHDTKRSEDVRARLAVLAEVPAAWEDAIWRWAHHNEAHRTGDLPDRPTEYLLYQTLVGAWPLTADRAKAYLQKATKEAKLHTSWIDPEPDYDDAVASFVDAVLSDAVFVADLEGFLAEQDIVAAGHQNSLLQTALKLTCPGVPDIYQGTELWDLSLVDPDNRRPIDFDLRHEVLLTASGRAPVPPSAVKTWLIHRLLQLRAQSPELFAPSAGYTPLLPEGRDAERIVAFTRGDGLVVVGARFPLRGTIDPETTVELPTGTWVSALESPADRGGREAVAGLLDALPVAVLTRKAP
jgi:(1->4)-alpha-D-glucan 1-alpha-D-glucosylmutase